MSEPTRPLMHIIWSCMIVSLSAPAPPVAPAVPVTPGKPMGGTEGKRGTRPCGYGGSPARACAHRQPFTALRGRKHSGEPIFRAPLHRRGRLRASRRRAQGFIGAGAGALGQAARALGQETGHRGRPPAHWGRKRAIGAGNLPTPMSGFLPQYGLSCPRARTCGAPSSAFTAVPHFASVITLAKCRYPFEYSASLAKLPAQPRSAHFPRRTSPRETLATARDPGPAATLPARGLSVLLAAASANREPIP